MNPEKSLMTWDYVSAPDLGATFNKQTNKHTDRQIDRQTHSYQKIMDKNAIMV